jgi:hypothetical protein
MTDEAISSDNESKLDEDSVEVGDNSNSGREDKIWSRPQHPSNSDCPSFHWRSQWIKIQETPHVNKYSIPPVLFFMEVTQQYIPQPILAHFTVMMDVHDFLK